MPPETEIGNYEIQVLKPSQSGDWRLPLPTPLSFVLSDCVQVYRPPFQIACRVSLKQAAGTRVTLRPFGSCLTRYLGVRREIVFYAVEKRNQTLESTLP